MNITRRQLFSLAGASALAAASPKLMAADNGQTAEATPRRFWGVHQPGIIDDMPRHTYFVAFDVTTDDRGQLIELFKKWTKAADEVMRVPAAFDVKADRKKPHVMSGAAVGLGLSNLTVNFGFGPSLFSKDGVDRFGIESRRPEALVDLPRFAGDQLIPEKTGGICVSRCALMTSWSLKQPFAVLPSWPMGWQT